MMARPRTKGPQDLTARSFAALRSWPTEALHWLHTQFDRIRQGAGPTYAVLLTELQSQFNLTWNDSSLSRYYHFWHDRLRLEEQAHTEAIALAEHFLKDGNVETNRELLTQLLTHQRLVALSNLGQADPATVVQLGIQADRIELGHEKLAVDRATLELAQQRLAALQARLAAAEPQVEELVQSRQITPEAAAKIRAIYGLEEEQLAAGPPQAEQRAASEEQRAAGSGQRAASEERETEIRTSVEGGVPALTERAADGAP